MIRHPSIDFASIASAVLSRGLYYLEQWLPGGKESKGEYKALNPTRSDSKVGSFSVNLRTGAWADFATDDKGGDLISLYAYLNNLEQLAAAKVLAGMVGIDSPGVEPESLYDKAVQIVVKSRQASISAIQRSLRIGYNRAAILVEEMEHAGVVSPIQNDGSREVLVPVAVKNVVDFPKVEKPKPPKTYWNPILPAPGDAGDPPVAHPVRGKSDAFWSYKDISGSPNGFVHRFRTSDGGKETLPVCFAEHSKTGAREWRWMAFPEPRPLYGLDKLAMYPELAVLLVEGEKCAEAAARLLPDFVVVTWPGGSKAVSKVDWLPLYGRIVYAWADCDAQRERLTKVHIDAGIDPESMQLLPEDKQPGMRAMLQIRDILTGIDHDMQFHFVNIQKPGAKPNGWDVYDAIDDGMNGQDLTAFIHNTRKIESESEKPIPLDRNSKSKPEPKNKKPIDWGKFNRLVKEFVLIYGTDTCFDIGRRMVIKINHLRLAAGAEYVKMWLASDKRRMILPDQLVFDPSGRCKPPDINLFDGLPMVPIPGDFEPIMELLYHLCADSADNEDDVGAIVQWTLKWLALPLQKLGTKMRSALVFHGPQGAGKNLFFEIIAKVYGRYAIVVGQEQIEDKFNDWASQKLFVIGDEVVARQELYHQKNKLKAFITGETIQINTKMMPLRTEANHVNVVFLSNEHQPLALEVGDRRYFVIYTPPSRNDGLYKRVAECLDNGGVEAFYHYLMKLDLSGFSEFDHPPMTAAKRDLIDLGLRPTERFLREWFSGHLPLPLHACSAGQLFKVFKHWSALNGERFPPNQEQFTKTIKKSIQMISRARNQPDLLTYKVVKIPYSNTSQKSERCWIPHGEGPGEDQTEGAWMACQIANFNGKIDAFTDRNGGDDR